MPRRDCRGRLGVSDDSDARAARVADPRPAVIPDRLPGAGRPGNRSQFQAMALPWSPSRAGPAPGRTGPASGTAAGATTSCAARRRLPRTPAGRLQPVGTGQSERGGAHGPACCYDCRRDAGLRACLNQERKAAINLFLVPSAMLLFLVPSAPFRSLEGARLELGADGDGAGGGVSPPPVWAVLLIIECCQASTQQLLMLWLPSAWNGLDRYPSDKFRIQTGIYPLRECLSLGTRICIISVHAVSWYTLQYRCIFSCIYITLAYDIVKDKLVHNAVSLYFQLHLYWLATLAYDIIKDKLMTNSFYYDLVYQINIVDIDIAAEQVVDY
jgi:hypothetical protein